MPFNCVIVARKRPRNTAIRVQGSHMASHNEAFLASFAIRHDSTISKNRTSMCFALPSRRSKTLRASVSRFCRISAAGELTLYRLSNKPACKSATTTEIPNWTRHHQPSSSGTSCGKPPAHATRIPVPMNTECKAAYVPRHSLGDTSAINWGAVTETMPSPTPETSRPTTRNHNSTAQAVNTPPTAKQASAMTSCRRGSAEGNKAPRTAPTYRIEFTKL
mmetsp:Transcript_941/g.2693  ORF Transcript_941/g.2693 Transcript_941/m.2693 type:complete len:219 (+) Transcript_941:826-1482(+)